MLPLLDDIHHSSRLLLSWVSLYWLEGLQYMLPKEQHHHQKAIVQFVNSLYRTSESRALLVNECIARRERSYIAAIVVLGEIGDRSCLDVLRNIASSDDDKWVRERALESIRRIEQRKE